MKNINILFAALVSCSIFSTIYADDHSCQRQISMQIQEEGWVSSQTAQVSVAIQAASNKEDVSALMDAMTNKLKHLIKQPVSWRLVDLSTQKNDAGLFAVSARMTARLTHQELAQLQASIESLNKAGEQYKIADVDYQPTLAEISAENTKLREQIYHAVLEQQEKINLSFQQEKYQLQSLNLDTPYVVGGRPNTMMYATANGGRQAQEENAMPFSQHLVLTANVTFSSLNPECKKLDGK